MGMKEDMKFASRSEGSIKNEREGKEGGISG